MSLVEPCEVELLDTLRVTFALRNDAQVATFLGLARATISVVRSRQQKLGLVQRLKLLDAIGFPGMPDLIDAISTPMLTERLQALLPDEPPPARRRKRTPAPTSPEAAMVELAKRALGCTTDDDLVDILGLSRTVMPMIRAGRTRIGPRPRLRLLCRLTPFDLPRLEHLLTDTPALIALLRAHATHLPIHT